MLRYLPSGPFKALQAFSQSVSLVLLYIIAGEATVQGPGLAIVAEV